MVAIAGLDGAEERCEVDVSRWSEVVTRTLTGEAEDMVGGGGGRIEVVDEEGRNYLVMAG